MCTDGVRAMLQLSVMFNILVLGVVFTVQGNMFVCLFDLCTKKNMFLYNTTPTNLYANIKT